MRALLSALFLASTASGACGFDTSAQLGNGDDANTGIPPDAKPGSIPDAGEGSTPDASPDAAPDATSTPTTTIRINVSGSQHEGIDYPGSWAADPPGSSVCGPSYYENLSPVAGTQDDALFVNVAFGDPMVCSVGDNLLPSGNYRVRLYFAEIYFGSGCPGGGGTGNRVFNIELEGNLVESNLDIFELAGCTVNGGTPHIASFDLLITDGTLNIEMPASANNGMIAAIELVSLF